MKPSQLAYRYGPEVLEKVGPLLRATWSIPSYIEDALQESGQAVPSPVSGLLLVDTGAVATCIAIHTAELLNLRPTRLAMGYGAGGEHTNPVFFASLTIDSAGSERPLVWQGEVQGIPDLEKYGEDLGIEINGASAHIVGLLGRDLLRHSKLEQHSGIVVCTGVRVNLRRTVGDAVSVPRLRWDLHACEERFDSPELDTIALHLLAKLVVVSQVRISRDNRVGSTIDRGCQKRMVFRVPTTRRNRRGFDGLGGPAESVQEVPYVFLVDVPT